jgi:glycosyltransferase involved in cell wall biosynthesis
VVELYLAKVEVAGSNPVSRSIFLFSSGPYFQISLIYQGVKVDESIDVSIVIPAYNEEESAAQVMEEIKNVVASDSRTYEIIVVDDGSTDNTSGILEKTGVRVIRHEVNKGYGATLKTGIRHARGEIVVITDADGTYPNEQIPTIVGLMENYDMVVGARIGNKVKIPLIRRPAKWALGKLANYLSGSKIPDLNSGLRAFRRDVVKRFFNILPNGFSFTTTITLGMQCNGYLIYFHPIDYFERGGKSKIHPIKDTLNFVALIIRTIMYFNPLKVFLPVSFFLFVLGLASLAYDIWIIRNIGDKTVLALSFSLLVGMLAMLADLIVKRTDQPRD